MITDFKVNLPEVSINLQDFVPTDIEREETSEDPDKDLGEVETEETEDLGFERSNKEEETLDIEIPEEETEDTQVTRLIDFTNEMQEEGLIPFDQETLPDDIKDKDFGWEQFVSLIRASIKKTKEDAVNDTQKNTFEKIVGNMPEIVQKSFQYSLSNTEESDVQEYMKTLLYEQDIKALDPTTPEDAERIVYEWYKDQGFSQQDREKKISKLKERGDLQEEAELYKPRLDKKAEEIATAKVQQQAEIRAQEQDRKEDLKKRVVGILEENMKNGMTEVMGIPVDQEMAGFLYHALINDEIPVKLQGKTVDLTVSEAIVLHHKYSKDGNLRNLMRALILLHAPEKFDEHYKKNVVMKETERFIKDHRMSSQGKSGLIQGKEKVNTGPGAKMRL